MRWFTLPESAVLQGFIAIHFFKPGDSLRLCYCADGKICNSFENIACRSAWFATMRAGRVENWRITSGFLRILLRLDMAHWWCWSSADGCVCMRILVRSKEAAEERELQQSKEKLSVPRSVFSMLKNVRDWLINVVQKTSSSLATTCRLECRDRLKTARNG